MSGISFKTSLARLGNISVQPIQRNTVYKSVLQSTNLIKPEVLPVNKASTEEEKKKIVIPEDVTLTPTFAAGVTSQATKNLEAIAKLAINKDSIISKIYPQVYINDINLEQYLHKSERSLPSQNKRFESFADLYGISKSRPEIVVSLNFNPIMFSKNVKNEYGDYIDAQIQLQNLKVSALKKLVDDLNQNVEVSNQLKTNELNFVNHIKKLNDNCSFLQSITSELATLRRVMNLRTFENVDYPNLTSLYFSTPSSVLSYNVTAKYNKKASFVTFLTDVGFTTTNIKTYSNTKLYVQTIYECKKLFKGTSDEYFGLETGYQATDNRASILKTVINDTNEKIATLVGPHVGTLISDEQAFINESKSTFYSFDKINKTTKDYTFVNYILLLSKELLYSAVLKHKDTVKLIENTFGYKTKDTENTELFDYIFGNVGSSITDNLSAYSKNSLSTLAQDYVNNSLVLNFETDYINNDASVYIPGGDYISEETLKLKDSGLNTTILKEKFDKLNTTTHSIKNVFEKMNDNFYQDSTFVEYVRPIELFRRLVYPFLDEKFNIKKQYTTSALLTVLRKVNNKPEVKASLLAYFLAKSLKIEQQTGDITYQSNSAILGSITDRIVKLINESDNSKLSFSFSEGISNNIISQKTISEIESELKGGSKFIDLFTSVYHRIIQIFEDRAYNRDGKTVYSGITRDVIRALALELMIIFFDNVSNVEFTQQLSNGFSKINTYSKNIISTTNNVKNNTQFINFITARLQKENDLLIKSIYLIIGYLDSYINQIKNTLDTINKKENIQYLNNIQNIVGSREHVSLLMNDQQIFILKSMIDDIVSKYDANKKGEISSANFELNNSKNDLVLLDDMIQSKEIKSLFFDYFSDVKFLNDKGFNRKILSIGLPQGFSKYIKERVSINNISETTYSEKENDIIKINVFKTDVRYHDIIFKPLSYEFELSRFISKDHDKYKTNEKDMLNAVLFRDYSSLNDLANKIETHYNDSTLFTSNEYDFLSKSKKQQILKNHVESYMLELYIKLLTGLSVSDGDLCIDDSVVENMSMKPFVFNNIIANRMKLIVPTIAKEKVTQIDSFTTKYLQGISLSTDKPDDRRKKSKIEDKSGQKAQNEAKILFDLSKLKTVYSDELIESKKIFMPKLFDRVFNITVDPDDFEIDYIETIKMESGKKSFEQLKSQGEIISAIDQFSSYSNTSQNVYKIKERSPLNNDTTFEKFFINIETSSGT